MACKKFSFCSPEKNDVVVFDNEGSYLVRNSVLEGISNTILYTRFEIFHITLPVFLGMVKNFGKIDWKYALQFKHKRVKKILQQIYRIYLLSCLEYISPKIVITFIDNSIYFRWLCRDYKKGECFAIQNGIRNKFSAVDLLLPDAPHPLPDSLFSMPNLFCFGQNDVDYYRKLGHKVDNFFPVGSLRASFFKKNYSSAPQKTQFDICLISEWTILDMDFPKKFQKSISIFYGYLAKFIEETRLSLGIATCSDDTREVKYFKSLFGKGANITKFDKANFSSYSTIEKSKMLVAFFSTLAIEGFGWGKKILLCNYSGDDDYNAVFQEGIWALNGGNYELFKLRMLEIYNMDIKIYSEMTKKYSTYLMEYDKERSTQNKIRGHILDYLKV